MHGGAVGRGSAVGTWLRAAVLFGVVGALLLGWAQSAFAIAESLQERGRTVGIVDGDTIKVNIWGDGTNTPRKVRLTGVNTNEAGQCHAAAATARTRRLTLSRFVRLYAIDVASHSRDRMRRTVYARQPDGTFKNLARRLVGSSLANASPLTDEWGRNSEYRRIEDDKKPLGRRIWDKNACGSGPQGGIQIRLRVNFLGDESDESVSMTNLDDQTLQLGGWWVRNTSPDRYVFPSGTRVPPGRRLLLRAGRGTRTGLTHFWGANSERFLDPTHDQTAFGGAAFLVDPQGDIRRSLRYP